MDEILSKAASEISKDGSIIKDVHLKDMMPELTDVTAHLNALGEESLKSLGLAKMTPIGIIQQILEMIHVNLDVPWIGAIAICKIWLRKFPCVIDTWARLYKKVAFYWREVNAIFIKKKLRDETTYMYTCKN